MIEKFYSKVDKKILLFSIISTKNVNEKRMDASPETEYLQSSVSKLKKGFKIKPHKHKSFERKIYKTQEAWFLVEGKILAEFFDIDDKKVFEKTLNKGDLITIFNGGHCFKTTEDTIFLEFKNGPYFGREIDREDILK